MYKKPRTIRPYTTENFWELTRQFLKNRYMSAARRKISYVHTTLLYETSIIFICKRHSFQNYPLLLSDKDIPCYLLSSKNTISFVSYFQFFILWELCCKSSFINQKTITKLDRSNSNQSNQYCYHSTATNKTLLLEVCFCACLSFG